MSGEARGQGCFGDLLGAAVLGFLAVAAILWLLPSLLFLLQFLIYGAIPILLVMGVIVFLVSLGSKEK